MKVTEWLLWPALILYSAGARLRAWSYRARIRRQKRLNAVVVSVGNITTGGTGKTPMVLWLAQRFIQNGEKAGILSRGYRPLPPGQFAESAGRAGWNDEIALLHGRLGTNAEYGIGGNRFRAGKQLESRAIQLFILDDGFQHLQLARDVNIVMIDGMNPFGGGHVLPLGRLREPLSALRRADIVVIHRCEERAPEIEAVVRRYTAAPVFFSQTKLLDWRVWSASADEPAAVSGRKFFAFCGIGNPSGFLADLNRWGAQVLGHRFFRDHHRYTRQDLTALELAARKAGADSLICTEKDIYDLPAGATTGLPVLFCRIAMQFDDEEALWRSILTKVEREQAKRRQ